VTQSEAVSVPEPKPRVLAQNPQDNSQHQRNIVGKQTQQVAMPSAIVSPAIVNPTPVAGKLT
jgi:hypothetical protein